MNKGYKIKIGDMLDNVGNTDIIKIKNKPHQKIDSLTKKGITAEFYLQSLNKSSIRFEIKNLKCQLESMCEVCGETTKFDIKVKKYTTKFVTPDKHPNPNKEIYDKQHIIDPKALTIDASEVVYQSIYLESPTVLECKKCQNNEDRNSLYDSNPNQEKISSNNINWTKVNK